MKDIPGENLKVLLAIRSMEHGGGAESLIFNIYNELKRRPNIEVKIVAFRKAEESGTRTYYQNLLSGNPDFYYCNANVSLSLLGKNRIEVSAFKTFVNDFKPHIIHSNLFIAEVISREITFPPVKYFTHTHDNMKQLKNFSLQTLTEKELLTNYYERTHLMARYKLVNNNFIVISEDTRNYYHEILPKKLSKNIFYLENAIVIKPFAEINKPRTLDKIRIVNVGGFLPKKNQKFMIPICEELLRRGLDVEITLLGDGVNYQQVKALVEERGLEKYISMPGNVVNVKNYYAGANLYVHTANYEPFGLVLLEAMASGLPVIALDGKGNRVLIKEGINGYLLYEEDAVKFADIIEKVIKDETLYRSLSKNAVEFAAQYDIQPYVDKLLEIYEQGR